MIGRIGRNYVIEAAQVQELLSGQMTESEKTVIDRAFARGINQYRPVFKRLALE